MSTVKTLRAVVQAETKGFDKVVREVQGMAKASAKVAQEALGEIPKAVVGAMGDAAAAALNPKVAKDQAKAILAIQEQLARKQVELAQQSEQERVRLAALSGERMRQHIMATVADEKRAAELVRQNAAQTETQITAIRRQAGEQRAALAQRAAERYTASLELVARREAALGEGDAWAQRARAIEAEGTRVRRIIETEVQDRVKAEALMLRNAKATEAAITRLRAEEAQARAKVTAEEAKQAAAAQRQALAGAAAAAGLAAGAGSAALLGAARGQGQEAMAFDAKMRDYNSLAQLDEGGLAAVAAQVLALTRDLPQGAAELAAGLKDIEGSGFGGAEGLKMLAVAGRAATAGNEEAAVASKVLVGTLNAYSLGAEQANHVSDVLFKTVDIGVLGFGDLARNLGDVTATSSALKVPLEQVGAAVALMTKNGIVAPQAFTALNGVLNKLSAPSESAMKAAQGMGLAWFSAAGNAEMLKRVGLPGVLAEIAKATQMQPGKVAAIFDDIEARKGALSLMRDMGKEYSDFVRQVGGSAGATDRALAKQMESFENQLKLAENALTRVKIALGSPLLQALTPLLKGLGGLADAFERLPEPVKRLVGYLELFAGLGLGVVAIASAAGLAAAGLAQLLPAGAAVAAFFSGPAWGAIVTIGSSALGALGTALAGVAPPVGLAIAALAALVAAWEVDLGGIRSMVAPWASEVGDAFEGLAQNIQGTFAGLGPWLADSWAETLDGLGDLAKLALGTLDAALRAALDLIRTNVQAMYLVLTLDFKGAADTWTTAAQAWASSYGGVFSNLWAAIQAGAKGHFSEMLTILREGQTDLMASAIARGEAMLNDRGAGGGGSWGTNVIQMGPARDGFGLLTGGRSYPITSRTGWRIHPVTGKRAYHPGTDLGTGNGTTLTSPGSGRVASAGPMGGYGNTVVLDLDGGVRVQLSHLAVAILKAGDLVQRGTVVARSGNSGLSTGPHTDVKVWLNGAPLDTATANRVLQQRFGASGAAGANLDAARRAALAAAGGGSHGQTPEQLAQAAIAHERRETGAGHQAVAQEIADLKAKASTLQAGSEARLQLEERIGQLQKQQAQALQRQESERHQAQRRAEAASRAASQANLAEAKDALSLALRELDARMRAAEAEGYAAQKQALADERAALLEASLGPQMAHGETQTTIQQRLQANAEASAAIERHRLEAQAQLDEQLLQRQAGFERATLAAKLAALDAQQKAELAAAAKAGVAVVELERVQASERRRLQLEHHRAVLAQWEQAVGGMLGALDVLADGTRTVWAKIQAIGTLAMGLLRDSLATELGGVLDEVGADLEEVLAPVKATLAKAIADAIKGTLAGLAGGLSAGLTAVGTAAAATVAALNPVTLAIGGAVLAAGGLAYAFKAAGDAAAEAARKAAALNTEAGLLEAERSENPFMRSEAARRRAQHTYEASVAEASGGSGGVVNAWGPEGPPLEVSLKLQAAQAKLFADLAAIGAEDERRRLDAAAKLAALQIQMAEANGDEALADRLRFEEEVLAIRQEVAALERDGALLAEERGDLEAKLIQQASDRLVKAREERREEAAKAALQEMERAEMDALDKQRKALEGVIKAKKQAAEDEIAHIDERLHGLNKELRAVQAIIDVRRRAADEEKARFNQEDKGRWASALAGVVLGDGERTYEALDVQLQTAQTQLDLEEIDLAQFQAIATQVALKKAALSRLETRDTKVEAKERERIRRIEAEAYQAWQQLQLEAIDAKAEADLGATLQKQGLIQADIDALGLRRQVELDTIAEVDFAYREHFKGLDALQEQAIAKWQRIGEEARKASAVTALGGATAGPAKPGEVRPNLANPSQMLKWDGTRWNVAATGGLLAGGIPGVDSIPVLAQEGELIVSNPLTERLQAFLGNPWDFVMPTLPFAAAAAAGPVVHVSINNPMLFDRAMLSHLSEQVSREIARNL